MKDILNPIIDVIMIGNQVSKNSKITIAAEAITKITDINADLCFLGINAIDIIRGPTENDWEIAQLKKSMIHFSQKVVCCTISEKINTLATGTGMRHTRHRHFDHGIAAGFAVTEAVCGWGIEEKSPSTLCYHLFVA